MMEPKTNFTEAFVEDSEKPVDFKYYLYLIAKNLYVVITFVVIASTLAAIYAAKIPESYQTSAQILIERPEATTRFNVSQTEREGTGYSDDYYTTQLEIIRSTPVLRTVVEELKLANYFGVENPEDAVGIVRGMVSASQVGESHLFMITAVAHDSQLAASVANALARAYIRKNFENMLYFSKEVLAWAPQAGQTGDIISVEDPFGNIKQMTRTELIETLPSIQTDPAVQALREKKNLLEAEIESQLKQYREKHPIIVKARANLKFVEESMRAEKERIVQNLKTQAEGRYSAGRARILEEAKVPLSPIPVDRTKIVVVTAAIVLILSFLVIGVIDFFDTTIRSVEDLERKGVILPFLGPVPFLKEKTWEREHQKALITYYQRDSNIAESFRYLRVAINFSATPESLKTLIFSSCLPHEGKSFTSHNIAVSLAMDGNKTLLVDCDLRRPVVHQIFKIDNNTGLSNYLTSDIEISSVVKESFVENLSVVTSGPISPNPGEILGSARMRKFIEEARKQYDRVIIDSPPLTGIGDTYILGSLLGQIIMVIAAGKTPADLIKHTQKQLEKTGVKILGAVISMIDMEKERYGGYSKHYYHTYSRYYKPNQNPTRS
jgi:capsular exopolysaccharide synthesis family protein